MSEATTLEVPEVTTTKVAATAKVILTKAPNGELLKALQKVVGIVERRHTLPILNNILITKNGDSIRFTTSDLEHQLESNTALGINDSFANVTVPARKLQDVLKSLPEEASTTLTLDGEKMVVTSGKSRFTLTTLPAADFPLVEKAQVSTTITLKQRELRSLIGQVNYAMAHNDVRYYLNGMLLVAESNTMTAVATDGHRLAMSSVSTPTEAEERKVIIATKVVNEIHHLLQDSDDEVEIQLSSRQVVFQFNNLVFTAKLIEGNFPDFKRVIPKNPSQTVTFDRAMLLTSLKRGQLMASEKFRAVKLTFSNDTLELNVGNGNESVVDEIGIDYSGASMTLGMNIDYLIAALSNIETDTVAIGLRGEQDSILLTEPDHKEFRGVIMPMRV